MQLYFIRHGQSINNAGWGNPKYKENPDSWTEVLAPAQQLFHLPGRRPQRVCDHLLHESHQSPA